MQEGELAPEVNKSSLCLELLHETTLIQREDLIGRVGSRVYFTWITGYRPITKRRLAVLQD